MNLFKSDDTPWKFEAFPGSDLKLYLQRRPNWFWRFTQRWVFGFVWTKA